MQNLHKPIAILLLVFLATSLLAQTWSFRTPMPTARSGIAAAVLDEKVYVVGGRSSGGPHGGHSLDVVEIYDAQNDQWQVNVPQLNYAREQASAIALDNAIYVFGGLEDGNVVPEIEKYLPGSGGWQVIGNMPNPRHSMATVVYDSLIWFIGGISSFNNYHQTVSVYNTSTGQWNTKSPLNIARGGAMAFVLNDTIYTAGGFFFGPIRSVEWFDQVSGTWQFAQDMPLHCATGGYATFGNRAWIVGGTGQAGLIEQTQILVKNGVNNGWIFGPSLNIPRRELAAVVVNDHLFAIGGRGSMGHSVTGTVEMLDLLTGFSSGKQDAIITQMELANFPNPFNPSTTLRVKIPLNDEGELLVYDTGGRLIAKLFNGKLHSGIAEFSVNLAHTSSGVYWAVWQGNKYQARQKMILLK